MGDADSDFREMIADEWRGALNDSEHRQAMRRLTLVRAAGRAFGRKGFHKTTLDEIAAELSVTKPMLYRYVKSKQEILYECHRIAVTMAEEAYEAAILSGQSPLEQISLFAEDYVARITSTLGSCVVLTEFFSMTDEDTARIQARRAQLDRKLRSLVSQAIEAGEIAPCDAKMAVFFFMGAINGISRWFMADGSIEGPEIAKIFAAHITASLRPTKDMP
ncbi:TetR/AcrR family transcriptional regulator [Seohaeicola zhoushanensis]|uniref:TetR family transcriptional regulator n=1 Tax=Seohaeicola zhoushanensis TaxID=1569283 RepID=A0A8J3GV83_9RHOB|nr:TetR/AcrR family transcriptional regulator [Seohaeicola zhoushanensis]GHF39625.1 TetR family transcriptional regulator [Seohaeicola zhoushanensis]